MRPLFIVAIVFLFGNVKEVYAITIVDTYSIIFSEIGKTEKMYTKEYYDNGNLKAEGWSSMDTKTDYWTFYHKNGKIASKGNFRSNKKNGYWYFYNETGTLIKEGHFENGSAEKWWIFHDIATRNKSKFQYRNNQKNGFALRYKKRKLVKAEEYLNGIKTNEWTSVIAFKLDNPNVSLR